MTNISKNSKKVIFAAFWPLSWFWILSNWIEDATLLQFFLINLYLFDSIFSGIVCIDNLHNCVEEICHLNKGCYGNEKETLF